MWRDLCLPAIATAVIWAGGMQRSQVAICKLIYSEVRNRETTDAARLLSFRQWDKFPWQVESTLKVDLLSSLPSVTQHDTVHTLTVKAAIAGFHILCVCRGEAKSPDTFEDLGCREQLDPRDSQDSEDPRDYCYGTTRLLMPVPSNHALSDLHLSKPNSFKPQLTTAHIYVSPRGQLLLFSQVGTTLSR